MKWLARLPPEPGSSIIVADRIAGGLAELAKELRSDRANAEISVQSGAAYRLPGNLAFSLVADFDSFLFQTRAAYELMVRFVWSLLRELGSARACSQAHQLHCVIQREISSRGGKTGWIEDLRSNRHVFAHETAAWPALQISSLEPLDFEVVFLKRNVKVLNDMSSYVSLRTLRDIYAGFYAASDPIENWLSSEVDAMKG